MTEVEDFAGRGLHLSGESYAVRVLRPAFQIELIKRSGSISSPLWC
jgi:hypothetical protein